MTTLEEKLKAKVTLFRPEGNTSGMVSKVIPELVAYIKLSDAIPICKQEIVQARIKENEKYLSLFNQEAKYLHVSVIKARLKELKQPESPEGQL